MVSDRKCMQFCRTLQRGGVRQHSVAIQDCEGDLAGGGEGGGRRGQGLGEVVSEHHMTACLINTYRHESV